MREAQALQETRNRRVVHDNTFGIGERIAQLEERDVRVLGHQFFKETDISSQLACARRTAHRRPQYFEFAATSARLSRRITEGGEMPLCLTALPQLIAQNDPAVPSVTVLA